MEASEDYEAQLRAYEAEVAAELDAQVLEDDQIWQQMHYREFVSRSYGRRHGIRRLRRHWKEVVLLRYPKSDKYWYTWRKFPWDKYAQELLTDEYQCDDPVRVVQERIIELARNLGRW